MKVSEARAGGRGSQSPAPPGDATSALIGALNDRIDRELRPLVPAGPPYALVDFPDSSNVGDSAIWLGELAWLRRNGYGAPAYTCSNLTFSPKTMRRRLAPGSTILLSGGGNFGDLYPPHQRLREKIVASFTDYRIVQLPQTIHFESGASVARVREIFDRHPDLTILVRDTRSLEFVRNTFRAARGLCPDMALCLGALDRPFPPTQDVVWLARDDRETVRPVLPLTPAGVARVDWLSDTETPLFRLNRLIRRAVRNRPQYRNWFQIPLSWTYEPLARERLLRGLRVLGAGRVVISDRLHGHIMAMLLGIPHVVLDNSYGKVRAFYDLWTRESPLVRWCDNPEDALEVAAQTWPTQPRA